MAEREYKIAEEQEYAEQCFIDKWFDIGEAAAERIKPVQEVCKERSAEFNRLWASSGDTHNRKLARIGFNEGWYNGWRDLAEEE